VGGAGFYLLKPFFSANPAFFTSQTTTPPPGTSATTQSNVTDFGWNITVAPRVWLGYMLNDCWMIRGQYWHFDNTSQSITLSHGVDDPTTLSTVGTVGALPFTSTPLSAGSPPDTIVLGSKLSFNVADIEAVRCGTYGCWDLQGSVGARYVDLSQDYNATLTNPGDTGLGIAARTNQQSEHSVFHGFGPVVAGRASYPIGGGFSCYGSGRGSVVYGTASQTANQLFIGGVPGRQNFSYSAERDLFLPIGELELGFGWSMQAGRCIWTANTGVMSQIWLNSGAAAIGPGATPVQSSAFSGNVLPAGGSLTTATSSTMGLLGWTLTLGVAY
jgi:hypothetical protein